VRDKKQYVMISSWHSFYFIQLVYAAVCDRGRAKSVPDVSSALYNNSLPQPPQLHPTVNCIIWATHGHQLPQQSSQQAALPSSNLANYCKFQSEQQQPTTSDSRVETQHQPAIPKPQADQQTTRQLDHVMDKSRS
jgi:hypothetical protein